ncbi:MAG: thiamine kinase-like enzyme [Parasphingorhabdus sp.]
MSLSPIEKVIQLPCWKGTINPEPLSGGLSNHNFTVLDDGKKYVVRIGADAPMHNVLRFNEHACGKAAETIGITPRQVFASEDALVIEFIEGQTFDAELVRKNVARILQPLRILHEQGTQMIRGPVLGFSVFHVARHYKKLLDERSCRSATELPRLMEISDELEAAVGAIQPALCHNDLLAANFIDDGNKIWIIDWEHAGFSTPLFDLASIASNSEFPEQLEREMLALYYSNAVDDKLWRRFKALRVASHQRETMWSMVAEIYSELDEDYESYTEQNLAAFNQAYENYKTL